MAKNESKKLSQTEILETETTAPEAGIIQEGARRRPLFAALYSREYRYLWSGALLSNIGTWIQTVALGWFVLQITNSEFALGLVNFAAGIPTFFLALAAGVIADRYERRSLLLVAQTILMLLAFTLGILITLNIASFLNIIAISLAAGIATSFSFPAWLALIPETVPQRDLMNAVALNSAQFNVARLIGPAIAGLVISLLGVAASFYVNALSFMAVIIALAVIKVPPIRERNTNESVWQNFTEGITFARNNSSIAILLILIGMLTIFGLSHTVLMPAFARDILKVGARGLGYLLAASGFGAAMGALIVAGLSHLVQRKTLIKISISSYSIFLLTFALSNIFALSLIAQVGVGMSFLMTTSSINTSLQTASPAKIRGRVMSLFVWAFMGLFPLGSFLIGSIAHYIGSPLAVTI
ncbi:MAG TPA: MFS transporter, partial [Anaerolineae bacterium]|nr:MFS transporter [Anaerolineae bacterium]